jgi:hypothetical protein
MNGGSAVILVKGPEGPRFKPYHGLDRLPVLTLIV